MSEEFEELLNLFKNGENATPVTVDDLAIATIHESVRKMLELSEPAIAYLSDKVEFAPGSMFISKQLILRCIARKAYESLSAILNLVKFRHTYSAMALLRSMSEELIFAKFIKSLLNEDADAYLIDKTRLELLQGMEAQTTFFSSRHHPSLSSNSIDDKPLEEQKEFFKKRIEEQKKRLKGLGKKLGWGNKVSPDIKYMAEKTRSVDIYNFFYHAASSSVHASLHHLFRMVWGKTETGQFSITNKNFERYYRSLVIVYGAYLFAEVTELINDDFPEMWIGKEQEAFREEVEFAISFLPPIVTREELMWRNTSR